MTIDIEDFRPRPIPLQRPVSAGLLRIASARYDGLRGYPPPPERDGGVASRGGRCPQQARKLPGADTLQLTDR